MAVLELTLVPIGTETTSLSEYIAKAYEIVKDREDIKVELNPMGTVLEGDVDLLFEAVRQMQEEVFDSGIDRLYTVIKIDDRRDKESSLEQKKNSVMEKLK